MTSDTGGVAAGCRPLPSRLPLAPIRAAAQTGPGEAGAEIARLQAAAARRARRPGRRRLARHDQGGRGVADDRPAGAARPCRADAQPDTEPLFLCVGAGRLADAPDDQRPAAGPPRCSKSTSRRRGGRHLPPRSGRLSCSAATGGYLHLVGVGHPRSRGPGRATSSPAPRCWSWRPTPPSWRRPARRPPIAPHSSRRRGCGTTRSPSAAEAEGLDRHAALDALMAEVGLVEPVRYDRRGAAAGAR